MSEFKLSEKPSHKLYTTKKKEYLTNKEFAVESSVESVDLSPSFSDLQSSFFSKDSSKVDKEILDQLNAFENEPETHKSLSFASPEDAVVKLKKNKEEETNYTSKPHFGSLKIEREEFRKSWLCQSCIVNEVEPKPKSCSIF